MQIILQWNLLGFYLTNDIGITTVFRARGLNVFFNNTVKTSKHTIVHVLFYYVTIYQFGNNEANIKAPLLVRLYKNVSPPDSMPPHTPYVP